MDIYKETRNGGLRNVGRWNGRYGSSEGLLSKVYSGIGMAIAVRRLEKIVGGRDDIRERSR
jgi:hypothetical protein